MSSPSATTSASTNILSPEEEYIARRGEDLPDIREWKCPL
jgi:phosphoketolase